MELVLSSVHRDWCVKESIEMNTLQETLEEQFKLLTRSWEWAVSGIRLDNQIYIPFTERGDTKVEQCSVKGSISFTPLVYLLDKNGDFKQWGQNVGLQLRILEMLKG